MDRNEIALRFAVATAQAQAMTNNGTIVKSEIMPNAFDLADAFMDLAERIDARPVKSGPCPGEDARDDAEARKRIAGRPPIVCLCGSTRFIDTFQSEYGRLTDEGNIVLSVGRVVPQSEQALGSERKVALDALHLRKIDLCDRVLVLNVGGYVGPSTRREIEYAKAHSKPVDLLYPDAGLDGQPPVAPKSEAAKYEPRVPVIARAGDTIRVTRLKDRNRVWDYVVASVDSRGFAVNQAFRDNSRDEEQYGEYPKDYEIVTKGPLWPVSPSPEATRPTHIRWTGSSFPDVVRRVVKWVDGKPVVGLMSTRTNNEAPDEARLSDPIEGEWFAAPAPVEPAKGLDVLAECADALDAVLREIGNINYLTFGTREWARTAVRNAREALAARGGS